MALAGWVRVAFTNWQVINDFIEFQCVSIDFKGFHMISVDFKRIYFHIFYGNLCVGFSFWNKILF